MSMPIVNKKVGIGFDRAACLVSLLLILTACGSGTTHEGSAQGSEDLLKNESVRTNFFTIAVDDYGLQNPNFFYSSDNLVFWSIQAVVATNVYDPEYRTIIRIDIPKINGLLPDLNRTFSIEDGTEYEKFPGYVYVFNGQSSTRKTVEQGLISFNTSAGNVTGSYDVILYDHDSNIYPVPSYRLAGTFQFVVGTYGPATPLPAEIIPAVGQSSYDAFCSDCHKLGKYDPIGPVYQDLSKRGGELPMIFPGLVPGHQSILIENEVLQALRIFLNAM